ncbi:MAG: outer membrane lipoprotein carrier protein LolA [Paludibacteraceae bacterium]|nr:outer membrane lipoprotein carrier protein LolA [Paludibacteraceae bacterium]MBR4840752.1 outer membrane lipoprotein carrier protein LolA [Paludibacteraceae bacterium]
MNKVVSKILLFLLLLTAFQGVQAQKGAKGVAVDPQAKKLLDKATAAFDSKSGLAVDFSLVIENLREGGKRQIIPGKILLRGDRFKLSVAGVDTYFDGKTEYVYVEKNKEVTINNPSQEDLKDINPLFLMKSYQSGYKMLYTGSVSVNGKELEMVDLYPDDLNNDYSIITIVVEKSTLALQSVKMQGKAGINTVFDVTKVTKKALADSEFVFNTAANKGVEVIDLR